MKKETDKRTVNLFDNINFTKFAHRGYSKNYTENTLLAFNEAYDLGYNFFELDVRASKDGEVYVFHDQSFKRLTGKNILISDLLSKQIDKIKLPRGCKVLRLDSLLKLYPNSFFNIDIKSNDTILPFCKVIKKLNMKRNICIASFSDKRINRLIDNLGVDVAFTMGRNRVLMFYICFLLGLNYKTPASCIQLPTHYFCFPLVTKKILKYAHNLKYKLHIWTINDEKEMIKYIEMGVDGIMTDECDILKSILIKKGIWTS